MKAKYALVLIAILSTISIASFAQNEYQTQLYDLTNKLNVFERKHLANGVYSRSFANDKLDMVKDFHRLGETAIEDATNRNLDEELGDIISTTTDLAVLRLTFLEYYLHYKKEPYKASYDKVKAIFLSTYLRVKTLEK